MFEQAYNFNIWLLKNTSYLYICYVIAAVWTKTITLATPLGVMFGLLTLNGVFYALVILLTVYLLFLFVMALGRWSDKMLDKLADKTAKKMQDKDKK